MKKQILAAFLMAACLSTSAFAATTSFTDVPADHWATTEIAEMVDKGAISGYKDGTFKPSKTVTNRQFITMLARSFYAELLDAKVREGRKNPALDISYSFVDYTVYNGNPARNIDLNITRYDMALMVFHVLCNKGMQRAALGDTIPSAFYTWTSFTDRYQDAVTACNNTGIMTGVDSKGTFDGFGVVTRAQAVVVLSRLTEFIKSNALITPASMPADALELTGSNTEYSGGYTIGLEDGTEVESGTSYNNGVFTLKNNGLVNAGGWIKFTNPGYSKLTFTVTVYDLFHVVGVGGNDSLVTKDGRLCEYQLADTTKAYTVDISGARKITMRFSSGAVCDATVSGVYLHN